MGENGGRRLYAPLSAEERKRFLDVLRETGIRRAAAAAIGVEPRDAAGRGAVSWDTKVCVPP